MIKIIEPNISYHDSFLEMLNDYKTKNEKLVSTSLQQYYEADSFEDYVEKLIAWSNGKKLKPNHVPGSTFWMVDESKRILGVSSLRHRLTEGLKIEGGHIGYTIRPTERRKGYGSLLLKETLVKAKYLGINSVLVTCDKIILLQKK